jgi:hypothetical protein
MVRNLPCDDPIRVIRQLKTNLVTFFYSFPFAMRLPLDATLRLVCHCRSAYTLLFYFRRSSDCMVYLSGSFF